MVRRYKTRSRRVDTYNANRRRRLPRRRLLQTLVTLTGEDQRRYHPYETTRQYSTISGRHIRPYAVVAFSTRKPVARSSNALKESYKVNFYLPSSAVLCARRKIRREVLFANNKTGKVGQRPPRYNHNSTINCTR